MSDVYVRVVEPIDMTDARLISTNIPETDYSAWSAATTYVIGDRVILTSTHKVYESLVNSNLNYPPATSPTQWVEVSPTNRWKVFDLVNSTQTQAVGSPREINYTVRMGKLVTCVAALNVTDGNEMTIVVTDPVYGEVYNETYTFSGLLSSTWFDWFFGGRSERKSQIIRFDLPQYPNADIEVTITGGANLAVGVLIFGTPQRYGMGVSYGARVGIQDYSRKETNEFGDIVLVERAFSKRIAFDMLIGKQEVDSLQRFLSKIRAKPALWSVNDGYEALSVFGIYKNFDILISYPNQSQCQIELEGLI